ncbi:MAG: ABC transporter substrate-binding protein, partial [Hyphomicrobiales bacterium]|nr:ABC transporter substrate-binding protein [Hyphomicrobiales bacterium]
LEFPPFAAELRELGYVDGQSVTFERRASRDRAALAGLAAALVRARVDIILAIGTSSALAAKRATKVIPVIFARVGDPVGSGLVQSLASPGGNLTGLGLITLDLGAKRLELLTQAIPAVARVGVLFDPTFATTEPELSEVEGASRSLHVELEMLPVRGADEFGSVLSAAKSRRVGALLVVSSVLFIDHRMQLAEFAKREQLATMGVRRDRGRLFDVVRSTSRGDVS